MSVQLQSSSGTVHMPVCIRASITVISKANQCEVLACRGRGNSCKSFWQSLLWPWGQPAGNLKWLMLPWWLRCDTVHEQLMDDDEGMPWFVIRHLTFFTNCHQATRCRREKACCSATFSNCCAWCQIYMDTEFHCNTQFVWWNYINKKTWVRQ